MTTISNTYTGTILFDPKDVTKKNERQSEWKKVAMVMFSGEMDKYYGWFLSKNYHLPLQPSFRGPHITFINDKLSEIISEKKWEEVKAKYNGTTINLRFDLSPRSNIKFWWLNVIEEDRTFLQQIRNELGLGRPWAGMHLTIGGVLEKDYHLSKNLIDFFTIPQ